MQTSLGSIFDLLVNSICNWLTVLLFENFDQFWTKTLGLTFVIIGWAIVDKVIKIVPL